jgi:hypothetical protein
MRTLILRFFDRISGHHECPWNNPHCIFHSKCWRCEGHGAMQKVMREYRASKSPLKRLVDRIKSLLQRQS